MKIDYMKHGEKWENNPKRFKRQWRKDREAFIEALYATDVEAMVAQWDDETLEDVAVEGSDLAFNRELGKRIRRACVKEQRKRNPVRIPKANGTAEAGGLE